MRCDSYASGNLLLYSRRISVAVNRCRHISWRVCDDGFFYGSLGFMFIIHRVSARPICCRGGWLCFDPVPDRVQILVASGSGFKETRWHHCESFISLFIHTSIFMIQTEMWRRDIYCHYMIVREKPKFKSIILHTLIIKSESAFSENYMFETDTNRCCEFTRRLYCSCSSSLLQDRLNCRSLHLNCG